MLNCTYACNSLEHRLTRRSLLAGLAGGATAGALGLSGLVHPAVAGYLQSSQRRVLIIFLAGGSSQLETWDPKPGTDTGGPFRAIPTSVPGIHICELLPHTAQQVHRLAIVRSINTAEDDHGRGHYMMETGRREDPAMSYPAIGSVAAKYLGTPGDALPGYIHITPGGGSFGRADAAFLGPKYASVTLGDGSLPPTAVRPESLSESADRMRQSLRSRLDHRFMERRRTSELEAYSQSFEQATELMGRREVFDVTKESPRDLERYGTHEFGRYLLLARRLMERGTTCVKVSHSNYDTHSENFDFHIEQLGEFDRPFATLIEDLADRGMLTSTLVVVMAEFGRTPKINHLLGRDHWSRAWSICLAGSGIQPGGLIGKTNANGTAVTDREVGAGHLFHTYFRALGLDAKQKYVVNGQPIPMGDPKAEVIQELLA